MNYKELTASEITKLAGIELEKRNCYTYRQNNLAVRGRKFIGEKGQSDRIGWNLSTGVFVACEVKKIGDTMKTDQIDFLFKVKKAGGFALIASQDKETGKFTLTEFMND